MTQFPQTATGVALVPPWACHAVDPHLEATVGELRTRGFELLSDQLKPAESKLLGYRSRVAGRSLGTGSWACDPCAGRTRPYGVASSPAARDLARRQRWPARHRR